MKINLHNYEAWLLDQLEGKLSPQQTTLLKAFVDAHPELGSWRDLTAELPVIPASGESYPDRGALLNIPALMQDPDELMAAAREGLATAEELDFLNQQISRDDHWLKSWRIYGAVYFKPDESVVFPDKHRLLRRTPAVIIRQLSRYSAAAVVVLLLGWGWWFLANNSEPPRTTQVAELAHAENKDGIEKDQHAGSNKTTADETTPAKVKTVKKTVSTKKAVPAEPEKKTVTRQQAIPPMPDGKGVIQLNLGMNDRQLIFYEPDLMQQLTLAAIIGQMPEYAEASQPGAGQRVKGRILQQALAAMGKPAKMRQKANGFDLWDIAGTGLTAYNFLTDNDVQLVRTTSDNGHTAISLEGERFSYDHKKGME